MHTRVASLNAAVVVDCWFILSLSSPHHVTAM